MVEIVLLSDIAMSITMLGKGSFETVFKGSLLNTDAAVKCVPKCGLVNLCVESRIQRYFWIITINTTRSLSYI